MFLVLPHLDVFKSCFENPHSIEGRDAISVLYNSNSKLLISSKYIKFLEDSFEESDFFQSAIKEISDSGRFESKEPSTTTTDLEGEFVYLANLAAIPVLLPIAINRNNTLERKVPFMCIKDSASRVNAHWIKFELAKTSQCLVTHLDFHNDNEIKIFFDNLYSLPRYIRQTYIFDRDKDCIRKANLKGKNVRYYTLMTGGTFDDLRLLKRDLQRELGGSLQLFSTRRRNLIHERKVIFENLILTSDNSFCNINKADPTWQITFQYSSEISTQWIVKCDQFACIK